MDARREERKDVAYPLLVFPWRTGRYSLEIDCDEGTAPSRRKHQGV